MSYILESFGGYLLPKTVLDLDVGTGEARLQLVQLPGGGAHDALGSNQAPLGTQIIQGKYRLIASSAAVLDVAYNQLRGQLGNRAQLTRKRPGVSPSAEWTWARLKEVRASYDPTLPNKLDLTMVFEKLVSNWYGFARNVGAALDVSPKSITLTMGGNASVRNGVLQATALGSNITALVIKRKVAGVTWDHLVYTGVIPDGQALVIDCGARSVKVAGSDTYAYFDFGAEHKNDTWFELPNGNNLIEVTRTGGGAGSSFNAQYYDSWV